MSISSVTSENLQLKLRQLLPSQQGFGTDLSASDTIIPIIDLTAAAEGSDVSEFLQIALAFGSQTVFSIANTNSDVATNPGFYRFVGTATVVSNTGSAQSARINLSDGFATKIVWQMNVPASLGVNSFFNVPFDVVIFLNAGEVVNLSATSTSTIAGSFRQVANTNGVLTQPVGFNPQ